MFSPVKIEMGGWRRGGVLFSLSLSAQAVDILLADKKEKIETLPPEYFSSSLGSASFLG